MASNDVYAFVKDYASGKSGIKVNESKQKVVIYSSTSALSWIFGFFCFTLGVVSLYHAEAIGLLVIAMGLVFFGALTRRTVFDIGKKEIRREICFITTDSIQPQQIRGYHTTAVSTRGGISSYVFGLKYGSKGNGLMKGIAAFKDLEDLQRFQGVVTRMLSEMNDIPQ